MFTSDDWRDAPTVTIRQAAAILGMSRATAYRAAKAGLLPVVKVSKRRYVVSTSVLADLLHLEPSNDGSMP
jgi:excisionase family DNA binding protein